MKKLYLLLTALLFITLVKAQNCDLQWTVKSSFHLSQFVTDSSGNSYAIGQKDSTRILITKYDAQGKVLWEKSQELTAGRKLLTIHTAIISKDSNLVIIGTYKNASKQCIYLMQYLATGNLGWLKENEDTEPISDIVKAELKSTTLFITARSGDTKVIILTHNLSGNIIKISTYADANPGSLDYIKSMTDDMNNIYIATRLTAADSTFINIRKFGANGSFQWHTLNFKGTANKGNGNLDFFVTDAGTSYTAFNRKDLNKSDTIIVTNYKTDGSIAFKHYQNLKEKTNGEQVLNLAIYGNDDAYIVRASTYLFEQGQPTFFIQYDKNNTFKWKYAATFTTFDVTIYDSKKNQLLSSGTRSVNQNENFLTAKFLKINTLTGQSATVDGGHFPAYSFILTKKNTAFWLIRENTYHVTKVNATNSQPAIVCQDFVKNNNYSINSFFRIQTDNYENLYVGFQLQGKDTTYISKYSTTLSVKNAFNPVPAITLYPNPGSKFITIRSEQLGAFKTLRIINPLGQVVYTQQLQLNGLMEYTVDLKNLPLGCYILSLVNNETKVSKPFIKME